MNDKEIKAYKAHLSRQANPQKYRDRVNAWHKANPDKVKAISLRYRQRNRAKLVARTKAWRLKQKALAAATVSPQS